MTFPRSLPLRLGAALLLLLHFTQAARAQVVISEIMAAASERQLQWRNGVPQSGSGIPWHSPGFVESGWQTGRAPFGYGAVTNNPLVNTNLQTQMQYLTPTVYLRKTFSVTAETAVRTDALQLVVEYNDGFVAYLNGVEVARRNGGPANKFIYHDQPAYNREVFSNTAPIPAGTFFEAINLGAAASRLVPGENILAVHALNASANDGTFYIKPELRVLGTPGLLLVTSGEEWRYFPGVVEPSGNVFDPALLGTGKLTAPWSRASYDDADWRTGTGPIGAGSMSGVTLGTNLGGQVIGVTPSVYTRVVFNVDAATAADTQPMQLIVQYDDGFVAYINGVEVARRGVGLPNTFTPRTAVADSNISPTTVTLNIDPPARLLLPGANVLAVQVHNYAVDNADLLIKADLRATSPNRTLVANNMQWRYLIGSREPILPADGEDEQEPFAEGPDAANDWIELHNQGAGAVSLSGWSLTDDPAQPRKWTFPPDAVIAAGGYLLVMADELDLTNNPGGYLHTNFKLGGEGEYVGLFNADGAPASQITPAYPRQRPFQSYARDSDGQWRYADPPTPRAENAGAFFEGIVATPAVNNPGRFYTSGASVALSTVTPGATIRYTRDGSEPTLDNSNPASLTYSSALTFTANTPLRARAFRAGWLPSDVIAHTYLINQSAARQSFPAACFIGDNQQVFYRPFGIFAISHNSTAAGSNAYTNSIWSQYIGNSSGNLTSPDVPPDPLAYNAPMQSGRPAERPVHFELLHATAKLDLRTQLGVRTAGSPYSRPRYVLSNHNSSTPNSLSPWSSSATQKPQLNVFFRSDLGDKPLTYPIIPGSPVTEWDNLRLRSGKNDISNPFIRDEFTRRLMIDMGQINVRGDFVNLYINGVFKGYFNITERPREKFFQEARRTSSGFDVRYIQVITDGDTLAYNEMANFARTTDPVSYANYQDYMARVDVVNIADYLILNSFGATADWPGNNYVMDRERSDAGRWRFSVWDAEGAFGGFSRNPAYKSFNDIRSGNVTSESVPAKFLYTQLKKSQEWRLLFADRLHKHFFNGGALADPNFTARYNELKNKVLPMIRDVFGSGTNFNEFLSTWLAGQGSDRTRFTLSGGTTGSVVNVPSRRTVLFTGYFDDTAGGAPTAGHYVSEGLWPATQAPVFSQHGGNVSAGYNLQITNPNAAGTVYYTTDGTDPRAVGGAVRGLNYTGPVVIQQSAIVMARVHNPADVNNLWSPLTEAAFTTAQTPLLLITEIMYRPPAAGGVDGDEFEFLEIKNAGGSPLALNGYTFTSGIAFTFAAGTTLAPGAFAILAKNPTQFREKYPLVQVLGTYGPGTSISNTGETLTLADFSGRTVFSVNYSSAPPWPQKANGAGFSLVPVNPDSNPFPNSAASWRASALLGGSPGADDPEPLPNAVVINEALSFPDPGGESVIELHNPGEEPADIGGWYLSDSLAAPKKFQLPPGAAIAPGGYLVVQAASFNPAFTLNRNGGEVWLSAGDAEGNLTGYYHGFVFNAAAQGVSFGRHVISTGLESFPAQIERTFGAPNAGPRVGPVVITEMMYYPGAGGDEFIELRNTGGDAVQLFDPVEPGNPWRIIGLGSGSPEWLLPTGVTLQPRGILLATQISPATFRTRYNIPQAVQVLQYPGALSNGGELIALQRPGAPYLNAQNQTVTPYIDVDVVNYSDRNPWPSSPNGKGAALERTNLRMFGDDPANWRGSLNGGTPGRLAPISFNSWLTQHFTPEELGDAAISGQNADFDRDGLSNFWEFAHGLNPRVPDAVAPLITSFLGSDDSGGPYLMLQFRRNLGANAFYHVDTAGALAQWQPDNSVIVGAPINHGDGTETIIVRDVLPSAGAQQRFIRLRVVGN